MTKSENGDRRIQLRGWIVALIAIGAWLIVSANGAQL